jgi:hypothetical protein
MAAWPLEPKGRSPQPGASSRVAEPLTQPVRAADSLASRN